jgi:primase-polymerase (primpol)-like protein
MFKYNLVIIEGKQRIPFLNLTEKEFYDKLWEWTYEYDLWDYLEEINPTDEELENVLNQFIRESMFHEYEDDDVDCFAFVNTDEGIVEYQISERLLNFIHNKIKEHYGR